MMQCDDSCTRRVSVVAHCKFRITIFPHYFFHIRRFSALLFGHLVGHHVTAVLCTNGIV